MIDFYDQTLDFLLIMQSMLEDFKPSNSGKGVFKELRGPKFQKMAQNCSFDLKIQIQLKWWFKSQNEDQKIITPRIV